MDLSFLKDVKLEAIKTATAKVRTIVPKLPVEADLRLFANGTVFPSEAFATEFDLEFRTKSNDVVLGNGLDIIPSTKWGMIQGKLPIDLVFIAAVPKVAAKVDLWASTKYDETGEPKASVFTQGMSTFSKAVLLPMLTEIYDIDWDVAEYVDFSVVRDQVISNETGIYHLPKVVSTGQHKGEDTYIRRENLTICPLIVADIKEKDAVEPKANLDEALNKADSMFTKEDATDTEVTEDGDPGEDWANKLGAKVSTKATK